MPAAAQAAGAALDALQETPVGDACSAGALSLLPPSSGAVEHQYLLCPVDGTLRYVRRGRRARLLESDAEQEAHLTLRHISVRLHRLQYVSGQALLQEFDRYTASAPHRHLRPHSRPAAGVAARLWWRYAVTVVGRQQQSSTVRALRQIQMVATSHRAYVGAYLLLLQARTSGAPAGNRPPGSAGGAAATAAGGVQPSVAGTLPTEGAAAARAAAESTVCSLDATLDEAVILLFRRMAHAKLRAARARSAEVMRQQQAPKQQQTWLGWLTGSAPPPSNQIGAPLDGTQPRPDSDVPADESDITGIMGPAEWNKLESMLADQAVRRWWGCACACL